MKTLMIAIALSTLPLAAVPAPEEPAGTVYEWPTGAEVAVLRPFEPPEVRWAPGHRGVDLALSADSPVLAAADGVVAFAGIVAGRPVVSIDHADGVRTTYEPVWPSVERGEAVAVGLIGGANAVGMID